MTNEDLINQVMAAVRRELDRATRAYPAFHSAHEGAAVVREEYDELWDGVKAGKGLQVHGTTGVEAVQLAAMAVRFILDCCDPDEFLDTLRGFERARS